MTALSANHREQRWDSWNNHPTICWQDDHLRLLSSWITLALHCITNHCLSACRLMKCLYCPSITVIPLLVLFHAADTCDISCYFPASACKQQGTPQNILAPWRLGYNINLEVTSYNTGVFSYWRTGYGISPESAIIMWCGFFQRWQSCVWWEWHILSLHTIAKGKFCFTTHNFRIYY